MRALVLGGCGFIGSHLVDALAAQGHFVRVLDRQPERFRPPLRGIEYCYGEFSDQMAVIEALTGIDTVFHLVSTTFPGTANVDPVADIRDNLINTIRLLDSMLALKVGRILFLSSGGTVYGAPDVVPVPEDHPLRPTGSYGIVKVAIEQYIEMYRKLHGLSSVIVRASNPYGPRQSHTGVQGVISTFLKRVHDGQPIEIWGDGTVVRDYLHVADLASCCLRAAASDHFGAFNAGSGEGRTLNDIVDVIRLVTGADVAPIYKRARAVDIARSVLDVSRAKTMLDWTTSITLEEGVGQSWDWLKELAV